MKQRTHSPSDRPPVVAGRFYPSSANELKKEIENYFSEAMKQETALSIPGEEILAVLSPHAGYVFSGTVSASAFLPLKGKKNIKRIFLIGSSHNAWFDKASVYYSGNYLTPLGKVKVDSAVANSLLENSNVFTYMPEAHRSEHSLEVQLPFLQYLLGDQFTIIPILLGTHSKEIPKKLAKALDPYFQPGNFFVVSTDLSHYPAYNDAVKIDKQTINALCSNKPKEFLQRLEKNDTLNIYNLSTSMCGWTSALTLMYLTENKKNIRYTPLLYQNSGDIPLYGEKSRVVGYQSVLVTQKIPDKNLGFQLSEKEKNKLLHIARDSISEELNIENSYTISDKEISDELKQANGVFVTVYCKDKLRGCIGRIESKVPLYQSVREMAISAAFHDTRFKSIAKEEMPDVHIEISVLTPLKKIVTIEEIVPGKHGILLRKDSRSGTYLPQVAIKTGWNAKELVEHCAREKAYLSEGEWQSSDMYTYEALIFTDKKE